MTVPVTGDPPPPLLILIPNAARGGRVACIGQVSRDEVVNDLVGVHVIWRRSENRPYMRMQRHTANSVAGQGVMGDEVLRHAAGAIAIGKKAHARALNLHACI